MSPWLRKELRVAVSPDRVEVLQVQRTLTLRGVRCTTHGPLVLPCDSASGAQPWHAALQVLGTALPEFSDGKTAATVILSNHFLRYAMVPWRDGLAGAEEDMSYTRHCFARVYGKSAQQWELRLNHESPEMPRLASAVDVELLDALRGLFDGAGIALKSVQPHLMEVFNRFRGSLRQHGAWFALVEPGNLCLALLSGGHWSQMRSLRIGSDWREELPLILDREACLADNPAVPHDVYVWESGPDKTPLPEIDPWQLHALTPAMQGRRFSLEMAG